MKKIPLTFQIFRGDKLLRTESLTRGPGEPIKIGKLASSHIRLDDDENVRRFHAVIEVTAVGEVTLIDLGSKGTQVNGKEVNKATLQNGDTVICGDTRIIVGIGEVSESDTEEPTSVEGRAVAEFGGYDSGAPQQVMAPQNTMRVSSPPPPARGSVAMQAQAATAIPVAEAPPQFGADAAADLYATRSIEVAAMLSDSVVAVKHLTNPKSGKLTGQTIAFFVIGAALLLSVAGSVVKGIAVSADNKEAYTQWVDIDKKPSIDFRPVRLSAGLDWLSSSASSGASPASSARSAAPRTSASRRSSASAAARRTSSRPTACRRAWRACRWWRRRAMTSSSRGRLA